MTTIRTLTKVTVDGRDHSRWTCRLEFSDDYILGAERGRADIDENNGGIENAVVAACDAFGIAITPSEVSIDGLLGWWAREDCGN